MFFVINSLYSIIFFFLVIYVTCIYGKSEGTRAGGLSYQSGGVDDSSIFKLSLYIIIIIYNIFAISSS